MYIIFTLCLGLYNMKSVKIFENVLENVESLLDILTRKWNFNQELKFLALWLTWLCSVSRLLYVCYVTILVITGLEYEYAILKIYKQKLVTL